MKTTNNNLIRPLTLTIQKELWEKFKAIVPRTITLNDAIVSLITKHIQLNLKEELK